MGRPECWDATSRVFGQEAIPPSTRGLYRLARVQVSCVVSQSLIPPSTRGLYRLAKVQVSCVVSQSLIPPTVARSEFESVSPR